MKKYFVCFFAVVISLASCATLADIDVVVDDHREQIEERLIQFEMMIVPLEAVATVPGTDARRMQDEMAEIRRTINEMERDTNISPDFFAKLLAWSGRLAILEGRYTGAREFHRRSTAVSAGNVPSIILGIRLEGDPLRRLELIEDEMAIAGRHASAVGLGELQIERARALFELNRFAESAGTFDAAFAVLSEVYSESYASIRNRAWELRNASGASVRTIGMMAQDTVSWRDIIYMTVNETQLLRFMSPTRTLTEMEYFNRLIDRGFLPFIQDITQREWPLARPNINETVTRAGAAFLVWHLYAESRADRRLLSQYSRRFATGPNPRSPIADVPALSPFFDSILGNVESGFLHLPDGRNFFPREPIRGTEVLAILRRIDG